MHLFHLHHIAAAPAPLHAIIRMRSGEVVLAKLAEPFSYIRLQAVELSRHIQHTCSSMLSLIIHYTFAFSALRHKTAYSAMSIGHEQAVHVEKLCKQALLWCWGRMTLLLLISGPGLAQRTSACLSYSTLLLGFASGCFTLQFTQTAACELEDASHDSIYSQTRKCCKQ